MLQLLRAPARFQVEQCERRACLLRYVVTMKNLRHFPNLLLLTVLCANLQAQPMAGPDRIVQKVHAKSVETQQAPDEKDLRARRGSDLRQALQPLKAGTASNLRPAPATPKPGADGTSVADATQPDSPPERHLTAKEREEMRQQLRQQRIRQLN